MSNNYKSDIGCWITIPSEIVAEIFSLQPYDFMVIDLEHSVISIESMQNLIRIVQSNDTKCLVRVSVNNTNLIKKVMDSGADGIIVPMVNNAVEVRNIIDSVYYPPHGKRGVGLARAQSYGESFDRYLLKNTNKEFEIIVQIEHIDAVHNLDEIINEDEVNGFMIGPYDLSASLGQPGNFESDQYKNALNIIEEKSKKHNKKQGIHLIEPNRNMLNELIDKNYDFIIYSFDARMLSISAKELF
jgi:2-dehydro-3-deoxyglucarate aldolase